MIQGYRTCPACRCVGSARYKLKSNDPVRGKQYLVYQCLNCGDWQHYLIEPSPPCTEKV